jgi:hypothetical protein
MQGCTRAGCHAKSRAAVAHIVAGTTARVERGSVGSGQVEGVWWRCRDGCCVMGGRPENDADVNAPYASRRAIHALSFGVRVGSGIVEVWERARWRGGKLGLGAETYISWKLCGSRWANDGK